VTLHRFPLCPRLLVDGRAGRAARQLTRLSGTSDWRRGLLDRTGAAVTAVAGIASWSPSRRWPWPELDDAVLTAAIDLTGIELVGAVLPRQPGRRRLSLLYRGRHGSVVVKLGAPGDGIEHEADVLRVLMDEPLPAIATPAVLAAGVIDADEPIAYVATDGLGLDGQRPAIGEALVSFERDLAERLAVLPRPHGTPSDAVPVHGDLTPWNLRRTGRGLALFDWEDAGWGPTGSDLAHYRRACDDLRRAGWFRRRSP
jgi:hypothetical protein